MAFPVQHGRRERWQKPGISTEPLRQHVDSELSILRFISIVNEQLLSVYDRVVLKQVHPELQEVYKCVEIFFKWKF